MITTANSSRRPTSPWRVALLLPLACAPALADAADGKAFAERVMAARVDAGADPQRGLASLGALRAEVQSPQQLERRLLVDEAECRISTDLDAARARAVAEAGLALAGENPASPAREPALRLRICRASVLLELGDARAGGSEIDAVLALTRDSADAGIQALAMLERGVHRSRTGVWQAGQQDVLAACEQLARTGPARDHELCLGHLANHYRRIGDGDEALRLLNMLSAQARKRGAIYDDSIYTFGIGQVLGLQQRWAEAIASFELAAQANHLLGDMTGLAYSEQNIASALIGLGRPQEALDHAERALQRMQRSADPRQHDQATMTRAEALAALGRAAEANVALDTVEVSVRQRGAKPGVAQWLTVRASAMRQLGRWREAYQALSDAHDIEDQLQRQRLSEQSARMRMQFNRARDAEELSALRQLNEQGLRLRQTQAVALMLFVTLLAGVLVVAVRKFRLARRLQILASTDDLTGLANRRALLAFADDAIARAQRGASALAVLMIDIDHFKRINDSHGHTTGDQVLRHVARVLASGLRVQDRLGRLGGEEFLAVLPGATLADALQVAERMRSGIDATPLIGPSGEVRFTVSIGVAGVHSGETAAALIDRADAALYRAKHGGRNAVAVDDSTAVPGSA